MIGTPLIYCTGRLHFEELLLDQLLRKRECWRCSGLTMRQEGSQLDLTILVGNFCVQRGLVRQFGRRFLGVVDGGILQEKSAVRQASELAIETKVNEKLQLGEILGVKVLALGVVV